MLLVGISGWVFVRRANAYAAVCEVSAYANNSALLDGTLSFPYLLSFELWASAGLSLRMPKAAVARCV